MMPVLHTFKFQKLCLHNFWSGEIPGLDDSADSSFFLTIKYKMPRFRARGATKRKAAVKRLLARRRLRKRQLTVSRMGPRTNRYYTAAGSMTNSIFKFGRVRRLPLATRIAKGIGAPDFMVWNGGFQCGTSQGKQTYYGFNSVNQGHLKDIMDIVGNQTAPSQCFIENAISQLSLTNITNTNAEIEIYDIIFKRDVPNSITWVNNSITYTVPSGNVADMIAYGCDAAAAAPAGDGSEQVVGTTPYDSQVFKAYCKVVKKTHVMLGSGATHRHQSLVNISKRALQTVAAQDGVQLTKGYAFATLIKVVGAPGYIPSGELATLGTSVDLTIQAVYSLRVKYTFIQDVTSGLTVHDVLAESPAATTRNPGSGVLELVSP